MRNYGVNIPIAGHFWVEVKAENEEEAIKKAREVDTEEGDLTWETLDQFNQGNVCYCPSPWKIEVEDLEEVEE